MARSNPQPLERILLVLAFVVVFIGGGALFAPPAQRRGVIIFFSVLGVLMVVLVRHRRAEDQIKQLWSSYMRFSVVTLVMTMVPALFLVLSRAIIGTWPLRLQIALLIVWGLLLVAALLAIATNARRKRMLTAFARFNIGVPAAYSFSVLMLACLFFSSTTFLLTQTGHLVLIPASSPAVTLESLSDFYLWHFLDAVPLLKVNDTLKWKLPLTYTSSSVGLIVLLFKVVVIAPVIGAFTWYARRESAPKARVEPNPADGAALT